MPNRVGVACLECEHGHRTPGAGRRAMGFERQAKESADAAAIGSNHHIHRPPLSDRVEPVADRELVNSPATESAASTRRGLEA